MYSRRWILSTGKLQVPEPFSTLCSWDQSVATMDRAEMAFGILDDRSTTCSRNRSPGGEQTQEAIQMQGLRNLRHSTGKDADIVLAPQPSDDPSDPFNWSIAKTILTVAILILGAFLMSSCFGRHLLSAGIVVIAVDLQNSMEDTHTPSFDVELWAMKMFTSMVYIASGNQLTNDLLGLTRILMCLSLLLINSSNPFSTISSTPIRPVTSFSYPTSLPMGLISCSCPTGP